MAMSRSSAPMERQFISLSVWYNFLRLVSRKFSQIREALARSSGVGSSGNCRILSIFSAARDRVFWGLAICSPPRGMNCSMNWSNSSEFSL